jgi:RNA polymerase sigma-70 factor (ECF subfamily)
MLQNQARQLLERYCKNSDHSAFNSFYRSHSGKLWQFLRSRGCSEDTAYDLLAGAFMKFIQVVCRDLRAPVALLYRIAINLHTDDYRRSKSSPVTIDSDLAEMHAGATVNFDDQRDYLEFLMKTLPQYEQNLLFMRYWSGMTHKEIAAAMNIPEGTIRRQCAAIIKKLQQRWAEEKNGA